MRDRDSESDTFSRSGRDEAIDSREAEERGTKVEEAEALQSQEEVKKKSEPKAIQRKQRLYCQAAS
jgi:hypothetical protein